MMENNLPTAALYDQENITPENTTPENMTNETAQAAARLYHADAAQRVGLTLKNSDAQGRVRKYKVAHLFAPLADEDFFKYEEMKRVVQKISGTDVLSIQTEDQNLKAAEWLWNRLATGREGYKPRDDWREKTNLLDKRKAVENGLLAVFVVNEAEKADPFTEEGALAVDQEFFDDEFSDDVTAVVRLDCLFDEYPLTVTHFFNQPAAADVNDYERTMRKATNLMDARRGFRQKKDGQATAQVSIPSKARELCALYDRLIVRTEGYAGRIPAHHKREAILELFARDVDVTEGK